MAAYGRAMGMMRCQLVSVGSWPLLETDLISSPLYRLYAGLVLVFYTAKLISECTQLLLNEENMLEKAAVLIVFVCGCEYQIRMMYLIVRQGKYASVLIAFRDHIHLSCLEEYKQDCDEAERETFKFIKMVMMIFPMGFSIYFAMPPFTSWLKGAFDPEKHVPKELPFSLALPYDWKYDSFNYWCTLVVEIYFGYVCMVTLFCQDMMVCHFITHLLGHLKAIERGLGCLTDGVINNVDHEQEIAIHKKIRSYTIRHRLVVNFVEELENLYGFLLLISFLCYSLCICFLSYQMTSSSVEDLIKFGIFLVGEVMRLSLISVYGNKLTEKNKDVSDAIYFCNWIPLSKRSKSVLLFFLMKSETPLRLTAMGFANASLETMASILKASFQYFTVLRTFED